MVGLPARFAGVKMVVPLREVPSMGMGRAVKPQLVFMGRQVKLGGLALDTHTVDLYHGLTHLDLTHSSAEKLSLALGKGQLPGLGLFGSTALQRLHSQRLVHFFAQDSGDTLVGGGLRVHVPLMGNLVVVFAQGSGSPVGGGSYSNGVLDSQGIESYEFLLRSLYTVLKSVGPDLEELDVEAKVSECLASIREGEGFAVGAVSEVAEVQRGQFAAVLQMQRLTVLMRSEMIGTLSRLRNGDTANIVRELDPFFNRVFQLQLRSLQVLAELQVLDSEHSDIYGKVSQTFAHSLRRWTVGYLADYWHWLPSPDIWISLFVNTAEQIISGDLSNKALNPLKLLREAESLLFDSKRHEYTQARLERLFGIMFRIGEIMIDRPEFLDTKQYPTIMSYMKDFWTRHKPLFSKLKDELRGKTLGLVRLYEVRFLLLEARNYELKGELKKALDIRIDVIRLFGQNVRFWRRSENIDFVQDAIHKTEELEKQYLASQPEANASPDLQYRHAINVFKEQLAWSWVRLLWHELGLFFLSILTSKKM